MIYNEDNTLAKPESCNGCALEQSGVGFMAPQIPDSGYGVALVGEALGEEESLAGKPFVGRAGFMLSRLLGWAGLDRSKFDIFNTVWCRPPNNKLDGQSYEHSAIAHCRANHWGELTSRVRVLVPMGNVPFNALCGRKGILKARGYLWEGDGVHIIPTVHPSFIQRGQSKYAAPFIHDVQKAVTLARDGLPIVATDYVLNPSPAGALEWARTYRQRLGANPSLRLAYDIETPRKSEDEGALKDDDDPTYFIWRIGFSYKSHSALSIPWEPAYIPAIKLLLESQGEKVVWNASFDNPRIRANGVEIEGVVHDGMVAWHILHSDLPKGLGFVVPFTCPWEPAWKHTATSSPALYNAKDADYEWRSFDVIERELRATGLWGVYQKDVLDLEPILIHMHHRGMPVDDAIRSRHAGELAQQQHEILEQLEGIVPPDVRGVEPKGGFRRDPKDTRGLTTISVMAPVRRCERCGLVDPKKPHFKVYKKKDNPCGGAHVAVTIEEVTRYARIRPLKVSSHMLIRYQQALDRTVPTRWDRKEGRRKNTMDDKAVEGLMKAYPDDPIYSLFRDYKKIDKVAGTYIGRPIE